MFQDAAGEGDDQVDVDVGVVFNASVTKGEQTLVYASSCSTLYARNGCMWIAWLFGHCLLFDASVLQAEQSSMSTCFLVQQQLHAYSLASDAIQITHWLSLRLSFPMLPEHCAPSQPVLHAAINLHLLQRASWRFLFQKCRLVLYGYACNAVSLSA